MTNYIRNSVSGDGYIQSVSTAYATAQAGSGFTVATSGLLAFGQVYSAPSYVVLNSYLAFDTSGLDGAVDTAFLNVYITTGGAPGSNPFNILALKPASAWRPTLTSGDWVNTASAGLTQVANIPSADLIANGIPFFYEFDDDALPANINTSGDTEIILQTSRVVAGTTPTGNEWLPANSGDSGSNNPFLDIDTVSAGARSFGVIFG